MNWTTVLRPVPVVLGLAALATGPAGARDNLSITANAPIVAIEPRIPGRTFLELPALEYEFQVHARCAGERSAESLSLAVADSHMSLAADQIASDGPTNLILQIPAGQLAPIVVENFCAFEEVAKAETMVAQPAKLTISAALSAQASLLCANEDDKAMTYVSQALDVSLRCELLPDEEPSPATE